MSCSKPIAWPAGVDVKPVVISVRDMQMPAIFGTIIIRVADERGFEVVVQLAVRYGDPLAGVRDVEETIVEVFVVGHVGRDIAMVNPDVGGLLDADGVASGGEDFANGEVADDDVALGVD